MSPPENIFEPAILQIFCVTPGQIFSFILRPCQMWLRKRGWSYSFSLHQHCFVAKHYNMALFDFLFYPPLFLMWPLTTLIHYHIWHPWTNLTQVRNCFYILFNPFRNPWGKLFAGLKKEVVYQIHCIWQMWLVSICDFIGKEFSCWLKTMSSLVSQKLKICWVWSHIQHAKNAKQCVSNVLGAF